jgi:hypothetical protein
MRHKSNLKGEIKINQGAPHKVRGPGRRIVGRSGTHLQRNHQEIIFPVPLIDPIGKISEEWHRLSLP